MIDQDLVTAWDCFLNYRALIADHAYPEMKKVVVALSFADDEHFPALQASDMAAFLARRVGEEHFYNKQNEFQRLYGHLMEASPSGSTINWYSTFAGAKEFEQMDKDLEEIREQQRVRLFRQNDEAIGRRSSQPDSSGTGSNNS